MGSIIPTLRQRLSALFSQGGERSAKARRNVFWMLLIKGGSILAGLLLVPITLNYVDDKTYGIWLTLSSPRRWRGSKFMRTSLSTRAVSSYMRL